MSDIFDYLTWRGDLTFGNAPLCPVDALILSILPYVRLEPYLPATHKEEPVRLCDAAAAYLRDHAEGTVPGNYRRLIERLAATQRFASLRILAAQKELDHARGMQFSAMTFLLPGQMLLVAFEGTDNTLIGWQEDLRMSYECPVPAQLRALSYLREAAAAHPLRRLYVAGHSKGGNLAMYAAVHSGPEYRHRIRAVYNHDGPGFCDDTVSSPTYLELRDRIYTYLPQSSIVAVLLEHDDNYKIVQSDTIGLLQHDPFSWRVQGPDFAYATERTAFGRETEQIIDSFARELSPERRRQFSEALFTVLEATEQETVNGIASNKLQSIKRILASYVGLDPKVREVLNQSFAALNRARKDARRTRILPDAPKSS